MVRKTENLEKLWKKYKEEFWKETRRYDNIKKELDKKYIVSRYKPLCLTTVEIVDISKLFGSLVEEFMFLVLEREDYFRDVLYLLSTKPERCYLGEKSTWECKKEYWECRKEHWECRKNFWERRKKECSKEKLANLNSRQYLEWEEKHWENIKKNQFRVIHEDETRDDDIEEYGSVFLYVKDKENMNDTLINEEICNLINMLDYSTTFSNEL